MEVIVVYQSKFCRIIQIQYVQGIINHVCKFKEEYINSNLQLTLF